MAEVSFLPSANTRKRASASREIFNCQNICKMNQSCINLLLEKTFPSGISLTNLRTKLIVFSHRQKFYELNFLRNSPPDSQTRLKKLASCCQCDKIYRTIYPRTKTLLKFRFLCGLQPHYGVIWFIYLFVCPRESVMWSCVPARALVWVSHFGCKRRLQFTMLLVLKVSHFSLWAWSWVLHLIISNMCQKSSSVIKYK